MEEEESKLGLSLGVGQCQFAPIHKLPKEHKQQVWFHLSLQPHMKEEIDIEAVEHKNNSTNFSSDTGISSKRDSRKKLMLTNDQLMLLEENFREHTILTPIKKNDLAEQLNLQPRQIEVWYQNRRARSKLKQKEMDCEFWKTLCESLRDENRKLKIELQDLRSRKLGSSLHVHVPPKMTPSFDKHERRKERGRPQLQECLDLITPN